MQTITIKVPARRRKRDPRYVVIDMDSGRVGKLVPTAGYVSYGQTYINPEWRPVFPRPDDEDDE
jgi:hypothetical protein